MMLQFKVQNTSYGRVLVLTDGDDFEFTKFAPIPTVLTFLK